MRKPYLVGVVLALAVAGAAAAAAVAAFNGNVGTHLKGRYEVPLRDTKAQGHAMFRVSEDGTSADYKLIASNIDNAFMAHIHMTAPGIDPLTSTGGIVVWLFPSTAVLPGPKATGRHDGVLAEGTITAANLVGALANHPLSDLLAAIGDGRTYVNVHTDDDVAPANTGPGDFPGGEVRGQLGT